MRPWLLPERNASVHADPHHLGNVDTRSRTYRAPDASEKSATTRKLYS
jgi:hypothetical protein